MALTLESTLGDITGNEQYAEVLYKYLPNLRTDPKMKIAKRGKLSFLVKAAPAEVGFTQEIADKVIEECNALG